MTEIAPNEAEERVAQKIARLRLAMLRLEQLIREAEAAARRDKLDRALIRELAAQHVRTQQRVWRSVLRELKEEAARRRKRAAAAPAAERAAAFAKAS